MSAPNRPEECTQSDLAAVYVLGALEDTDAERFSEHLSGCLICREQVAHLQPVADSLGSVVPRVTAPEELLTRVMSSVNAEAELLNAAGSGADRPVAFRPRRRAPSLLGALAGAGALAAGLAVGALVLGSGSQTPSRSVSTAVVAPNAPGAHAVLRQVGSRGELVISGMPQPGKGKVYELWLAREKAPPQPTDALFGVNRQGDASVGVPSSLKGVKQVMVTAEPLGGSSHPTSTPVIIATLKAA